MSPTQLIVHGCIVVVGVAALTVLAVTHAIAGDVAVPGITTFVGYGVGVGATAATTKTPS